MKFKITAKKWIVSAALGIVFMALLVMMLMGLTKVFARKSLDNIDSAYFSSKDGTYDVVFLGPSTIHMAVAPVYLWNEYGITGYNMGSGHQTLTSSYYIAKEAIETKHPKLIVLDITRGFRDEVSHSKATTHYVSDNMPLLSLNRIKYINEMVKKEDRLSFYFPLDIYHSRWNELSEDDYDYRDNSVGQGMQPFTSVVSVEPYERHEINKENAITERAQEQFRRIIELCKENDTELLFVSLPILGKNLAAISEENFDQRRNLAYAMEDFAQQEGVQYLNMFDSADEIGLHVDVHSKDGEHLNIFGARIFTGYIGKYLQENLGMQDRRGESGLSVLDKNYGDFCANTASKLLRTTKDPSVYMDYLKTELAEQPDRYAVIITSKGQVENTIVDPLAEKMQELGFAQFTHRDRASAYAAVLTNNQLLYEGWGTIEEPNLDQIINIAGISFNLHSDDHVTENTTVLVDGVSAAKNKEGMNILVYDLVNREVLDATSISLKNEQPVCVR